MGSLPRRDARPAEEARRRPRGHQARAQARGHQRLGQAEGRIGKTIPNIISVDETANVGVDDETPVTEEYKERDNTFTGMIRKVTIEVK